MERDGTRTLRLWWPVLILTGAAVLVTDVSEAGTQPAAGPPGMAVAGIVRGKVALVILRADGYTYIAAVGELAGDYLVVSVREDRVLLKRGGILYQLPTPEVSPGPPAAGPALPGGAAVTGIVRGRVRLAIIMRGGQTFIARQGERVGLAVVVSILPTKVILREGRASFELPAPSASPAPPRLAPGVGLTVAGIVRGRVPLAIVRIGGESFVVGVGERVGDAVVEEIRPGVVVFRRRGAIFQLPISGGGLSLARTA